MQSNVESKLDLPPLVFPVDRSRAFMRGVWRAACGVPLLCGAIVFRPNFELLWLSDWASCLALGILFAAILLSGALLIGAAFRWMALSLWPGQPQITVSENRVELALGPFGRETIPWREIGIALADQMDSEVLEKMPDDSVLPVLRHAATRRDLTAAILLFARTTPEACARLLRPYWLTLLHQQESVT